MEASRVSLSKNLPQTSPKNRTRRHVRRVRIFPERKRRKNKSYGQDCAPENREIFSNPKSSPFSMKTLSFSLKASKKRMTSYSIT